MQSFVSVGIMHEYSGKRCMHVILHLIMNLSLSLFFSMDIGDIEGWDTEWFS
jgi:hypothetical protein